MPSPAWPDRNSARPRPLAASSTETSSSLEDVVAADDDRADHGTRGLMAGVYGRAAVASVVRPMPFVVRSREAAAPQVMQVRSVQRLPMPHLGQRFSPSVDVPNGLSRVASSRSRRCRFTINRMATTPTATAIASARSWVC